MNLEWHSPSGVSFATVVCFTARPIRTYFIVLFLFTSMSEFAVTLLVIFTDVFHFVHGILVGLYCEHQSSYFLLLRWLHQYTCSSGWLLMVNMVSLEKAGHLIPYDKTMQLVLWLTSGYWILFFQIQIVLTIWKITNQLVLQKKGLCQRVNTSFCRSKKLYFVAGHTF